MHTCLGINLSGLLGFVELDKSASWNPEAGLAGHDGGAGDGSSARAAALRGARKRYESHMRGLAMAQSARGRDLLLGRGRVRLKGHKVSGIQHCAPKHYLNSTTDCRPLECV